MSRPLVPAQRAREELRRADERFRAAMRAYESYSDRLRELTEACEEEARALMLADLANVPWRPVPGGRNLKPPIGLTEPSERHGPPALWGEFDRGIEELGLALEGESIMKLAQAFARVAKTVAALADANQEEQPDKQPDKQPGEQREVS